MRGKLRYRSLRISIQRENRLNSSVYWIHRPEHTDMFSQGYIGVSNNTKLRWREHETRTGNAHLKRAIAKYSWDNLVKEVIVIADELYCLAVEFKLRSADKIGWNIVAGGGMPPSSRGKKFICSEETKVKLRIANAGRRHTPEMEAFVTKNLLLSGIPTRFVKGQVAHNKGVPILPHVKEAVRKANVGRKFTQEHRDKISSSNMGRVMSEHTKESLRVANMGRKPPMLGKHFPKVICPHCNAEGGLTGMKSWHFDNCRNKGE